MDGRSERRRNGRRTGASCAFRLVEGLLRSRDRHLAWRLRRFPGDFRAACRTDDFHTTVLRGVPGHSTRSELLRASVAASLPGGLYLEFGVFRGASLALIAGMVELRDPRARLYGFDSFQGLTEAWNGGETGAFRVSDRPRAPPNADLVVGPFQQTLVPFLAEHGEPVSFLHVDSDTYSSAAFVLSTLSEANRLRQGAVIVFDEYANHRGWWNDGEFLAFQQWVERRAVTFAYLGYLAGAGTVAVKLTAGSGA